MVLQASSGFGSRGTYRGDKITKRAFADVMRGDYVAQSSYHPANASVESSRTARFSSSMFAASRMTANSSYSRRASIRARPPTSARRAAASHPYTCSTTPRRSSRSADVAWRLNEASVTDGEQDDGGA